MSRDAATSDVSQKGGPLSRSDADLWSWIVHRDDSPLALERARQAFHELYERHAPALLLFLSARAKAFELEDLHQEVWVRVWDGSPQRFDGRNFRGWLLRIGRNLWIDNLRRRQPLPLSDEAADELYKVDQGPVAEATETNRRTLRRCLERLSAQEIAVVRARLAGEGYVAVCRRLQLTENRAYRVFHDAKKQLQDCVKRAET